MEILLVEDDLEDAGLTIEALRQGEVPCRISLVRDGEEAMEFLHRHAKYRRAPRPDLILLDLNMPRKDGREALGEIKSDPALRTLPVVVLTTSGAEEDIRLCYELGAAFDRMVTPREVAELIVYLASDRAQMITGAVIPMDGGKSLGIPPSLLTNKVA